MVVDAGNWGWKNPDIAPHLLEQQRLKAELVAGAYALLGQDGLVVGAGDLALGLPWLEGLGQRHKLPLLNANLSCAGREPFAGSRVVERGGLRVGLVGLMSAGARVPAGCTVGSPVAALLEEVTALGTVDVLVLLAQVDGKEAIGLATAVPAVDLIVTADPGAQFDAPRAAPGEALILAPGSRGKRLGVAEIALLDGATGFASESSIQRIADELDRARTRLSSAEAELAKAEGEQARARKERQITYYRDKVPQLEAELAQATASRPALSHRLTNKLIGLDAHIVDHPATAALLTAGKAGLEAAVPKTVSGTGQGPYVGTAACEGCHAAAAAQWRSTGHAHAWNSLERVGRQADQACFSCHATGAGLPGGAATPAEVTPALVHVGCESCHGPGKAHVADPKGVEMVSKPGEAVCVTCHDGKQDEGRFDLPRYLPRVSHGGP